jgi:hypothetical protein
LHDSRWSGQLTLQIGIGGGLAVKLILQLIDDLLLGLQLSLECCDLVALYLDKGFDTTSMGIAGITRTFPWGLRLARVGR